MHRFYILLFVCFMAINAASAQEKKVEEEHKESSEQLRTTPKSTTNSLIHKFVCQRCGSENQLDWGFPVNNKNLELIPHCNFCGKKYWPKFKPTGLLQRTYCHAESINENSMPN